LKAKDNRRFGRVCIDIPVTVEIDCCTGNCWMARALNVSVGGILVWSVPPLRLNVPLVIHFPSEWIRAFAVIIAVRKDGFYYGCQFINLAPKVVNALSRAVDHELRCENQLTNDIKGG
jgi:hypothetical protein